MWDQGLRLPRRYAWYIVVWHCVFTGSQPPCIWQHVGKMNKNMLPFLFYSYHWSCQSEKFTGFHKVSHFAAPKVLCPHVGCNEATNLIACHCDQGSRGDDMNVCRVSLHALVANLSSASTFDTKIFEDHEGSHGWSWNIFLLHTTC